MDIYETSAALREVDSTFNRVNWGGCAVVAALVAEKTIGNQIETRITACGNGRINIDEVRESVDDPMYKENWYDHGIYAFDHVWVEIFVNDKWWACDSTGIHPLDDMYDTWGVPCDGSFTLEEITSMANQDTWNSAFDRRQIDGIKAMIASVPFEFE